MQVKLNINDKTNLQFKARFSQKDVRLLMSSAKEDALFIQDMMARDAEIITGIRPQKALLDAKTMYGRLNAILEHVDKLKGRVVSLIEETLLNGKKIFKIVNEKDEVLGKGRSPMLALDNAFVLRGKSETSQGNWENKLPPRCFFESQKNIGEITEQDVLAKALD